MDILAQAKNTGQPSWLNSVHSLQVASSLEMILAGPAVKKILFMSSEARINNEIIPHFYACLQETDTDLTQAVPTMLEILPGGT